MTLPTPGTAASTMSARPPPWRSGPTRRMSVRSPGSSSTSTVVVARRAPARGRRSGRQRGRRRPAGRAGGRRAPPACRRRDAARARRAGPTAIDTVVVWRPAPASTSLVTRPPRRPARGVRREGHDEPAARAGRVLDLEPVGERGDQRQAEPGACGSGLGHHAEAAVGHRPPRHGRRGAGSRARAARPRRRRRGARRWCTPRSRRAACPRRGAGAAGASPRAPRGRGGSARPAPAGPGRSGGRMARRSGRTRSAERSRSRLAWTTAGPRHGSGRRLWFPCGVWCVPMGRRHVTCRF